MNSIRYLNGIRYWAGWTLAKLFPQRANRIQDNFTIPNTHFSDLPSVGRIDTVIHRYLAQKLTQQERDNPGTLESAHKNFWRKVSNYFPNTKGRAEELHIPAYQDIVADLKPLLAGSGIKTVYEFGTGDGEWLNYLSQQWPEVVQFVGIDISAAQIAKNIQKHKHLAFMNSDLSDWTETHAAPHGLYHTCGGVLEYVSENAVRILFQTLKRKAHNSMIFLIEPLYGDFNIDKEINSRVLGFENSYSHNYRHWLEAAGITVIRHEERQVAGWRMLIVVGQIE